MANKSRKSNQSKSNVQVKVKRHMDRTGGHPHVILGDIDNNHVSVGITSKKKKGKNSPNYKLENKPLGGEKDSYLRRQGTVAPKNEYDRPRKGELTPKDYAQAREYGERARLKYLEKLRKKK